MMFLKLLVKILLSVMVLNMTNKTCKTSKYTRNSDFRKNREIRFWVISPVLARHTPLSSLHLLFYYTTIDYNNPSLPSPALHTVQCFRQPSRVTMSKKRSIDEVQAPHTAILPQPAIIAEKGTDIVLPDDIWRDVVTFVDWRGFRALACACKTTRDAARDEDMLARDKVYVLRCFLALGGKEDTLVRGYWDEDGEELKMRDEPSDNLSEWLGVTVEGGRVTKLWWSKLIIGEPLTGTIPAEIGAFDGLTYLNLGSNQICGHLPSEIGRLTSLKRLDLYNNRLEGPLPAELGALTTLTVLRLQNNNFTGEIPSTLANLTNVWWLDLSVNNFDPFIPSLEFQTNARVQAYIATPRPNHGTLE